MYLYNKYVANSCWWNVIFILSMDILLLCKNQIKDWCVLVYALLTIFVLIMMLNKAFIYLVNFDIKLIFIILFIRFEVGFTCVKYSNLLKLRIILTLLINISTL